MFNETCYRQAVAARHAAATLKYLDQNVGDVCADNGAASAVKSAVSAKVLDSGASIGFHGRDANDDQGQLRKGPEVTLETAMGPSSTSTYFLDAHPIVGACPHVVLEHSVDAHSLGQLNEEKGIGFYWPPGPEIGQLGPPIIHLPDGRFGWLETEGRCPMLDDRQITFADPECSAALQKMVDIVNKVVRRQITPF